MSSSSSSHYFELKPHTLHVVQELLDSVSRADLGNDIAALLTLTLHLLSWRQRQQLGQLAIFPTGFDAEAAAAVLGWDEGQAQAALAILYRHGLVLWSSATQQHTLHMVGGCCLLCCCYCKGVDEEHCTVQLVYYTSKIMFLRGAANCK